MGRYESDFKHINSEVTNDVVRITNTNILKSLINDYYPDNQTELLYTVAYTEPWVRIGYCNLLEEKTFIFFDESIIDPHYLQRLRIFNDNSELYIWKTSSDDFAFRFRRDSNGELNEAVDTEQLLWGIEKDNPKLPKDWIKLEERGIELVVPQPAERREKSRIWLKSRYYVGYNSLGQAGFVDCRFMGFC